MLIFCYFNHLESIWWRKMRIEPQRQFWIHQDFLECYSISIIIYKNPKKLRKSLKFKNIFLESTASFRQNRVHQVNTGQTMSTRVKNEFRAISGQNRHFWPKPSSPGQYGSNHVDQDKKWVSCRFGSNLLFLVKSRSIGFISIESFFFMFQHNFR